jgi:hypothetical protein
MRKLDKPPHNPGEVFLTCISRVRNQELKARLEAVQSHIAAAATAFDTAAATAQLHTIPTETTVGERGHVTKDEMVAVYELRMVPKDSPGRSIYDEIITAPIHGRCPLCGHRDVTTLDHHLPKAHFPSLAVVPSNLVPSCSVCNKVKLEVAPRSQEEQTLHPYYDNVESDRWLEATVIENRPVALIFEARSPITWNNLKALRTAHHFSVFKLGSLYASQAADELLNIRQYLINLHSKAGAEGIRQHLTEMCLSHEAVNLNSWQSAAYRALSSSQWYCEGGFD